MAGQDSWAKPDGPGTSIPFEVYVITGDDGKPARVIEKHPATDWVHPFEIEYDAKEYYENQEEKDMTYEQLQEKQARLTYPDKDPETALRLYVSTIGPKRVSSNRKHLPIERNVKNVFFINEDGVRIVIRERKSDEFDKNSYLKWQMEEWHDGVCFVFPKPKFKRTTKLVNRQRTGLKQLKHCSDKQWKLDRSNPRHLLNWPSEILERIYKFILVPNSQASHGTTPYTIGSYWKRDWCLPQNQDAPDFTSVWYYRYDDKGPYIERHDIARSAIDATFLRACKRFHDDATPILYGQQLNFAWKDHRELDSMGLCYWKNDSRYGRCYNFYDPRIPVDWNNTNEVHSYAQALRIRNNDYEIPGWARCDFLIDFLRFNGPEKTKLTRSLRLGGSIMVKENLSDFLEKFRVYTVFFAELCPNISALEIVVEGGGHPGDGTMISRGGRPIDLIPINERAQMREKRLMDTLEKELPKFPALKEFRIVRHDFEKTYGDPEEIAEEKKIGDSETERLAEIQRGITYRAWQRKIRIQQEWKNTKSAADLQRVLEKAKKTKGSNSCGFCGEHDHSYTMYYNLCRFCGEFGHWKYTCPLSTKVLAH